MEKKDSYSVLRFSRLDTVKIVKCPRIDLAEMSLNANEVNQIQAHFKNPQPSMKIVKLKTWVELEIG